MSGPQRSHRPFIRFIIQYRVALFQYRVVHFERRPLGCSCRRTAGREFPPAGGQQGGTFEVPSLLLSPGGKFPLPADHLQLPTSGQQGGNFPPAGEGTSPRWTAGRELPPGGQQGGSFTVTVGLLDKYQVFGLGGLARPLFHSSFPPDCHERGRKGVTSTMQAKPIQLICFQGPQQHSINHQDSFIHSFIHPSSLCCRKRHYGKLEPQLELERNSRQ
jgi:hypothetical protein